MPSGRVPYADLAREIQLEVERISADAGADAAALDEAFEGVRRRARGEAARAAFDRLAPDEQWAVLERLFPDDELIEALAHERERRVAAARRQAEVAIVRRGDGLHVPSVPVGERLTLGLFREQDVRAGTARGPGAASCARRLVVRATEVPGEVQVLEDVFNPDGGYFVTADYDEATWRHQDRLPAHALVRLGSIVPVPSGSMFDPVLHLGGRVDVAVDDDLREGCLHLGYAFVGDLDVFAAPADDHPRG